MMFNFESPYIFSTGIEKLMDDQAVEALCSPSRKFRITGRAVLLEIPREVLTHLEQPVTLEVEALRLFVRPSLQYGHNHLPAEFIGPLPILVSRTFDGLDAYFGMTRALEFKAVPLG